MHESREVVAGCVGNLDLQHSYTGLVGSFRVGMLSGHIEYSDGRIYADSNPALIIRVTFCGCRGSLFLGQDCLVPNC